MAERTGKIAIVIKKTAVCVMAAALLLSLAAGIFELTRGGFRKGENDTVLNKKAATLKNTVLASLFNVSGNPDVIAGRDGWLYYSPTLTDYLGTRPLTEAEGEELVRRLTLLRDYCAAQGADFVFVCVPNKNSVYPEHMPDYYGTGDGAGANLERLAELLDAAGVNSPDLLKLLTEAREGYFADGDPELYYMTDTHWNTAGAAVCADWLALKLGGGSGAYADMPVVREQCTGGDLYQLLYPDKKESVDVGYVIGTGSESSLFEYAEPPRSMMDMDIVTTCADMPGKLLVFRDSFGSALVPLLSGRFGCVRYLRGDAPYDFTKVGSERPDAVVLVLAERNLRRLLECEFNGVEM